MTLETLLSSVRKEIEKSGIKAPVTLDLAFMLNQNTSGEVELDCIDARSRRSEHVHRMSLNLEPQSKISEPASSSEQLTEKTPPSKEEDKQSKRLLTPPALPKHPRKFKKW